MALRQIVEKGDSILNKKCRPVVKFDARLGELIDDMTETLHKADGAGLAAPQVGVLRRIVVIDVGDENGVIELVNPKIISSSGRQETLEGCLSLPGKWGYTVRPNRVKIKAQDRHGNEFEMEGRDLLAKAFCHEIDHLEGILFDSVAVHMLSPQEVEEMNKKNK